MECALWWEIAVKMTLFQLSKVHPWIKPDESHCSQCIHKGIIVNDYCNLWEDAAFTKSELRSREYKSHYWQYVPTFFCLIILVSPNTRTTLCLDNSEWENLITIICSAHFNIAFVACIFAAISEICKHSTNMYVCMIPPNFLKVEGVGLVLVSVLNIAT